MRPLLLVVLLLGTTQAVYITELSDGNFFEYAKDKDVLLVDFYAPWCGDCVNLAPEFDKAASQLGSRSTNMAKVDCFGAGKGLCQMYGVRSWPQLKNFNKGTFTGDYTGAQTGEAMATYVNTVQSAADGQTPGTHQSNPYAAAVPAVATPAFLANGHSVEPAKPVTSGAASKCDMCKIEETKPVPVVKAKQQGCGKGRSCIMKGNGDIKGKDSGLWQVAVPKKTADQKSVQPEPPAPVPEKPVAPRDMPDDKRNKIMKKLSRRK